MTDFKIESGLKDFESNMSRILTTFWVDNYGEMLNSNIIEKLRKIIIKHLSDLGISSLHNPTILCDETNNTSESKDGIQLKVDYIFRDRHHKISFLNEYNKERK